MSATYYDRPVLKEPVWKASVAVYFFTGGLAGASAGLGLLARASGNRWLARRCVLAAVAGAAVSPALLIEDLGRPERFHHMLRVLRPTSPMSVGTWVLSAFGIASGLAAASELTGRGRGAGRLAQLASGLLGLPLATYTAVLVANTSIPVWQRSRRYLPFLFAAGSAASAGALATLATPARHAAPARRLAVGGALAEVAVSQAMLRSLGPAAAPYETGRASGLARLALPLSLLGAAGLAAGGRWQVAGRLGALGVLSGALAERLAVWQAGKDSAREVRDKLADT